MSTPAEVQHALDGLVEVGVLEYVLPTVPLGERWVLGARGKILNLTRGETLAFISGVTALAFLVGELQGIDVSRFLVEATA